MPEPERQSLQFRNVKGTSAVSPCHFSVVGNKLAYVASGGVVVSQLDVKTASILSQRLYVANSANIDAAAAISGPNSYLNLDSTPEDTRRDAYGFPNGIPLAFGDGEDPSRRKLDADTGGLSPSKMKEKVRAISCVALAPNGKVLAVGETGYQPRILLFSLAPDSCGVPFAVIYEHSFGIKHIAFSPDLRHFCSLGLLLDGFLHVWRYSASSVSLRAGNKCSSVIHDVLWHHTGSGNDQIVTMGLRFVKIWSFEPNETPNAKNSVLKGRNVVLGLYLDTDFLEGVSLNTEEIVVAGRNSLFMLSLLDMKIVPVASGNSFCGLLADYSAQKLWYFDDCSDVHGLEFDQLAPIEMPPGSPASPSKAAQMMSSLSLRESDPVIRCFSLPEDLVYLTNHKEIALYNKSSRSVSTIVSPITTSFGGIKKAFSDDLLVFSKDGRVVKLDKSGVSPVINFNLPKSEYIANELSALDSCGSTLFLGDKYGLLFVVDNSQTPPSIKLHLKAHSSTINDIVFFEVAGMPLLCSISRDRMIQIYHQTEGEWDLLRTLPTHTANLIAVKFHNRQIFVCSADRSVSVHEIVDERNDPNSPDPVGIYQKKILALKNTPLSMAISDSDVVLSTNDRSLSIFDSQTLEFKRTLKLYNEKTNDSLYVDSFTLFPNNTIAVSSTDKGLRIFSLASGKHLSLGWGHSETILGIFKDSSELHSIGADGCLFTWILTSKMTTDSPEPEVDSSLRIPEPESSPLNAKVARKILPAVKLASSTHSSPTRRSLVLSANDETFPDPESPTPRLTSATLKRLEAKKKLNGQSSPRTTRSPSRPPTPLRISRPSSPAKFSSGPIIPYVKTGPTKLNSPSLPQPVLVPNGEAMDRTTAYLAIIKSQVQKGAFTSEEKTNLQEEMQEILRLLGWVPPNAHDDLLTTYSNKLIQLVEKKLIG